MMISIPWHALVISTQNKLLWEHVLLHSWIAMTMNTWPWSDQVLPNEQTYLIIKSKVVAPSDRLGCPARNFWMMQYHTRFGYTIFSLSHQGALRSCVTCSYRFDRAHAILFFSPLKLKSGGVIPNLSEMKPHRNLSRTPILEVPNGKNATPRILTAPLSL